MYFTDCEKTTTTNMFNIRSSSENQIQFQLWVVFHSSEHAACHNHLDEEIIDFSDLLYSL